MFIDKLKLFETDRTFLLYNAPSTYMIGCCGFVSQWDLEAAITGNVSAQIWRSVGGNWTLIGQNSFYISGKL